MGRGQSAYLREAHLRSPRGPGDCTGLDSPACSRAVFGIPVGMCLLADANDDIQVRSGETDGQAGTWGEHSGAAAGAAGADGIRRSAT